MLISASTGYVCVSVFAFTPICVRRARSVSVCKAGIASTPLSPICRRLTSVSGTGISTVKPVISSRVITVTAGVMC